MGNTINIPGGQAVIRTRDKMSVRQRRMVQAAFMTTTHIYRRLPQEVLDHFQGLKGDELKAAEKVLSLMIADLKLTHEDAVSLLSLQDASIVAFLDSWTLNQPLPTLDTVQDLDPVLYDALADATAAEASALALGTLNVEEPTPAGVDSPFVVSATSNNDSDIPMLTDSTSI